MFGTVSLPLPIVYLPSPTQETAYTLQCNSDTPGTYEHTVARADGCRLLCRFALIGGRAASRIALSRRWSRQSWQPSWPRRVFIRPTERNVRRIRAGASTNEVVSRASSAVLTPEARCLKGMAVRPPQPGGDWGRRAWYAARSHGPSRITELFMAISELGVIPRRRPAGEVQSARRAASYLRSHSLKFGPCGSETKSQPLTGNGRISLAKMGLNLLQFNPVN